MLKDRIVLLNSPGAVEAFLNEYPTSAIFKAGTCHKTMQGFGFVQERLAEREDLMCGVIRVVEARPASNLVADKTGITHESPQLILFKDGGAVFDVDNWDITPEVVEEGFAKLPVGEAVAPPSAQSGTNLRPYLVVLEEFLKGEIDVPRFVGEYTQMFRGDASLRTKEEVTALNSIFGDVDQHAELHRLMSGRADTSQLRERAQAAYDRLVELAQAVA